ncbi:MAG: YedE-related selenium metabolism membrane protein [Desulfuromonadales bacterium]|nr:YedE-related selenium metabolism membrane protein [Desulfuromonadales bacterium]NIR33760.1 YedE-related selenium metabolism membrane protein [Desulfuromonadales bacterium]NIS43773.1 YedE-related selenium metabolism membrane protein [Desulfuromonadales bacterium]
MPFRDRHFYLVLLAGLALGGLGAALSLWGNPVNSGICVSCFLENSAGALGLHDNARMQYLRPELPGFVLGAALSALAFREFSSRGGSAPLPRLISGVFLIVGSAVFIGCPIKMVLRLTAGDLTALFGAVGLALGVWVGLRGMTRGVTLGRAAGQGGASGLLLPALFGLLMAFFLARPAFLLFSETGSAAEHAPWMISLAVGLILGALAQRTRLCVTGGVRDGLLMGVRAPLAWGLFAFIVAATAVNVFSGRFQFGLYGQPGAHLDHLWSFLGMGLVGWISALIGGCPFRQLVKAGEGDTDAGLVVVGMLIGGAIVQSWGVAATAAGVSLAGKVAVLSGLLFVMLSSLFFRERTV